MTTIVKFTHFVEKTGVKKNDKIVSIKITIENKDIENTEIDKFNNKTIKLFEMKKYLTDI